ncbi:hypothetical protein GA0070606_6039 [Micromonospora citrea]|uniref:Uncharacterized protein n=1 Tax=Micromonospora citrea TaxID=47855 RepID=A0A1C6W2A4_9ACTN|nr:hypothetical protein GA0070606_6039 [Micromonospora citrea]
MQAPSGAQKGTGGIRHGCREESDRPCAGRIVARCRRGGGTPSRRPDHVQRPPARRHSGPGTPARRRRRALTRPYAGCNDPDPATIPHPRCPRSHPETGHPTRHPTRRTPVGRQMVGVVGRCRAAPPVGPHRPRHALASRPGRPDRDQTHRQAGPAPRHDRQYGQEGTDDAQPPTGCGPPCPAQGSSLTARSRARRATPPPRRTATRPPEPGHGGPHPHHDAPQPDHPNPATADHTPTTTHRKPPATTQPKPREAREGAIRPPGTGAPRAPAGCSPPPETGRACRRSC